VTTAPHAPSIAFTDLAGAVAALRERGVRLTAARRLVLEGLFAADRPVSADQLAGGLDGAIAPSDLASVYRNLETMERLGIVRHVHLGHGPGLYALAGREEREYLLCESCGRLVSLSPFELDPVRDQVRERFGFEARFDHFPLSGLCVDCAKEALTG
jgi:Fur family transcriptional regulator, ferric uptake regulator